MVDSEKYFDFELDFRHLTSVLKSTRRRSNIVPTFLNLALRFCVADGIGTHFLDFMNALFLFSFCFVWNVCHDISLIVNYTLCIWLFSMVASLRGRMEIVIALPAARGPRYSEKWRRHWSRPSPSGRATLWRSAYQRRKRTPKCPQLQG